MSRTLGSLQIGGLLSLGLTAGLCFLWTIPMSFIASLSSVEDLRRSNDFLDNVFDSVPILVPFFEVVAPLLVVIANSILPTLLEMITHLEGPISGAVVRASLFGKLAAFMVIQTFFVSAISGSVVQVSIVFSLVLQLADLPRYP